VRPRAAGLVRLGLLALLWGSSYLWISLALEVLDPLQITLGRLVLGAALLVAVVGVPAVRRLLADRSSWRPLLVAALLANVVPFLLFPLAQQSIGSGQAGALNATTPLWALAAALLSRRQRGTSPTQVGGLLLGLVGTVLVLAPWQADAAGGSGAGGPGAGSAVVGSLLVLVAAASYGVGYVYVAARLTSRGVPPTVLAASQLLAATLWLLPTTPWALAGLPDGSVLTGPEGVTALVALAVLGLGGTGVAYLLLYRIITDDGPVIASSVAYLLPVVALALGALVLDEVVTLTGLLGVACVLVGVGLTRSRPRAPVAG
jgi:drug/metabolite transporter (DMT)-like permease